jgi:hypothetical protein
VRCGVRREETLEEKEVEGEGEVRSWRGVRRSLAMVMRRPKEEGSERKEENWETSSAEAEMPDCMVGDYS